MKKALILIFFITLVIFTTAAQKDKVEVTKEAREEGEPKVPAVHEHEQFGTRMLRPYRKFFDQFFDMFHPFEPRYGSILEVSAPKTDVKETPTHYKIIMEIPGISKDKIKVDVSTEEDGRDVITIRGEKKFEKEEKKERSLLSERSESKFARAFTLQKKIKKEEVTAKYVDGELIIVLPKKEISKEETKKYEVLINAINKPIQYIKEQSKKKGILHKLGKMIEMLAF